LPTHRDWDLQELQKWIIHEKWDYRQLAKDIKKIPLEAAWNTYEPVGIH